MSLTRQVNGKKIELNEAEEKEQLMYWEKNRLEKKQFIENMENKRKVRSEILVRLGIDEDELKYLMG